MFKGRSHYENMKYNNILAYSLLDSPNPPKQVIFYDSMILYE